MNNLEYYLKISLVCQKTCVYGFMELSGVQAGERKRKLR